MTEMIIENDIEASRRKDYIKTIHNEGIKLSEMVSQLLNISTIEHGGIQLEKETLDLSELISSCINSLTIVRHLEEHSVSIKFLPPEESVQVVGDRNRLQQLLRNLIDNSLVYSDDGISITISIHCTNNGIILAAEIILLVP